jgi:phenylpyruvate tautomerase PptA (4-oxalocrotonate tautomerase family)
MPFVRITLREDTSEQAKVAISDGVHQALISALGVPQGDRFQVIERKPAGAIVFHPTYLRGDRQNVVCLEITLTRGRPVELKQALYRDLADNLSAAGVRGEDVFVMLREVGREDWSFGNGLTQLLDEELLRSEGWVAPSG